MMCAVQIIMITGCQTGVFFSFFWESGGEIENPWMTFAVNSDREAGMDRYTSKLSPAVDYGAGTFLLVVGKCCFFHTAIEKYKQGFSYIFYIKLQPSELYLGSHDECLKSDKKKFHNLLPGSV